MKNYLEESLKFIESYEMRDYLRTVQELKQGDVCAKIVALAPAPIERKIPVLDLLEEELGCENKYVSPAKIAQLYRNAFKEQYNTHPSTIFWVRDWLYNKTGQGFGDAFFTTFCSAFEFAKGGLIPGEITDAVFLVK